MGLEKLATECRATHAAYLALEDKPCEAREEALRAYLRACESWRKAQLASRKG